MDTPAEIIAELDPGIRDLVVHLRGLGFDTMDSGDGVSKAESGYLYTPFPHVIVQPDSNAPLIMQARALAQACAAFTGRTWMAEVQAAVITAPDGTSAAPDQEFDLLLFAGDYESMMAE
jgi:hypothetical protein